MSADDKMSETPKDKSLIDLLAVSEPGKSSKETEPEMEEQTDQEEELAKEEQAGQEEELAEEEKTKIEANPDLEDPRLYSPLQEPDRPDPSLRTHGEPHPDEAPPEEAPPEEEQELPQSKEG